LLIPFTVVHLVIQPSVSALRRFSWLLSVLSWLVHVIVVVLLQVVTPCRKYLVSYEKSVPLIRIWSLLLSLVSWLDVTLFLWHLNVSWWLLIRVITIFHRWCSFVDFANFVCIHACIVVGVLKLYLILIVYHYWLAQACSIFTLCIHVTLGSATSFGILDVCLWLLIFLMNSVEAVWVKSLGWLLIHGTLKVHCVWSCDLLALSTDSQVVESAWVLLIIHELKRVVVPRSTQSSCSLVWNLHPCS